MPITATPKLQFFWRDAAVPKDFRSGVSLHSHTMYSEESLELIPRYTTKVPYLGRKIQRWVAENNRKHGTRVDFADAFWTPPLSPRQAYRLEEKQIQRQFGLPALISITDHDDVRAGGMLRVIDRYRTVPASTEWSVPFGPTFFHLGVHNLPVNELSSIMTELRSFTARPAEEKLPGILEALNGYPDVLIVVNHPLWDEKGIGRAKHAEALHSFLERHGKLFHALELNGLRSWTENEEVIQLGRDTGLPIVSGGDRHGREPNAILNLSQAGNFSEFVHEVRYEGRSHVVFMPQYREPIKLRMLQTILDTLREYPESYEGRRHWADRVFYRDRANGEAISLSSIWHERPRMFQGLLSAVRLLTAARPAFFGS